jgi:hypothetical protein
MVLQWCLFIYLFFFLFFCKHFFYQKECSDLYKHTRFTGSKLHLVGTLEGSFWEIFILKGWNGQKMGILRINCYYNLFIRVSRVTISIIIYYFPQSPKNKIFFLNPRKFIKVIQIVYEYFNEILRRMNLIKYTPKLRSESFY